MLSSVSFTRRPRDTYKRRHLNVRPGKPTNITESAVLLTHGPRLVWVATDVEQTVRACAVKCDVIGAFWGP